MSCEVLEWCLCWYNVDYLKRTREHFTSFYILLYCHSALHTYTRITWQLTMKPSYKLNVAAISTFRILEMRVERVCSFNNSKMFTFSFNWRWKRITDRCRDYLLSFPFQFISLENCTHYTHQMSRKLMEKMKNVSTFDWMIDSNRSIFIQFECNHFQIRFREREKERKTN